MRKISKVDPLASTCRLTHAHIHLHIQCLHITITQIHTHAYTSNIYKMLNIELSKYLKTYKNLGRQIQKTDILGNHRTSPRKFDQSTDFAFSIISHVKQCATVCQLYPVKGAKDPQRKQCSLGPPLHPRLIHACLIAELMSPD